MKKNKKKKRLRMFKKLFVKRIRIPSFYKIVKDRSKTIMKILMTKDMKWTSNSIIQFKNGIWWREKLRNNKKAHHNIYLKMKASIKIIPWKITQPCHKFKTIQPPLIKIKVLLLINKTLSNHSDNACFNGLRKMRKLNRFRSIKNNRKI